MSASDNSAMRAFGKRSLDYCDGYPYLVTRIVPALYHIFLLPADLFPEKLLAILRIQFSFNHLQTSLVMNEDKCFYLGKDGSVNVSDIPPMGGILIYDRLLPCIEFPETEELQQRKESLKVFSDSHKGPGYLTGDLRKGGRPASEDEMHRLSGKQSNGVPYGLVYCHICGHWMGECLDPTLPGMVVKVHCRCENDNLCARCGEPLDEYKLNSNYYGNDGAVLNVPGFCGLGHRCK